MQSTIKVFNKEFTISLHDATVIHADKYSHTSWYGLRWPVMSTLYADIVFRSKETGQDWPVYTKDLDLGLYNSQEVSVISVNRKIFGYIDKQTEYYYYTTFQFAKRLGIGIKFYLIFLLGVVGGVACYFLLPGIENISYWFLPLVIACFYYYVQNVVINFIIKRAINKYLRRDK